MIDFPINLYCENVEEMKTLDLCRGDSDFRKVYIVDDGKQKIVVKHMSNTFTDRDRIEGWIRLMTVYRSLGIYCPSAVPTLRGELIYSYRENNRDYYIYAEEYAKYDTAEHIGKNKWEDDHGIPFYMADVMRALGKIANARLDVIDWHSAYCLLEPHSPPDTVDEGTECALNFSDYIKENLPEFYKRAQKLLALFYQNGEELKKVYSQLPISCFQGDLGASNVLLNEDLRFAGVIDFNLCGREPILNYTVREALWGVNDNRLYDENKCELYFYDQKLDDLRIRSFLKNMEYIEENYHYSELERSVFPILFRYMNSFWWNHIREIKKIKDDKEKVSKLLDWLEFQMTRDDIRLP